MGNPWYDPSDGCLQQHLLACCAVSCSQASARGRASQHGAGARAAACREPGPVPPDHWALRRRQHVARRQGRARPQLQVAPACAPTRTRHLPLCVCPRPTARLTRLPRSGSRRQRGRHAGALPAEDRRRRRGARELPRRVGGARRRGAPSAQPLRLVVWETWDTV